MPVKAVIRPGGDGLITDVPSNLITADSIQWGVDLLTHHGVTEQRWGWSYVTLYPLPTEALAAVRAKYSIPKTTNTIAVCMSGAGSSYELRVVEELNSQPFDPLWAKDNDRFPVPQGNYHGEQLFCFADGKTPMIRYSGSETSAITGGPNLSFAEGEATVAHNLGAVPEGQYSLARVGAGTAATTGAYVYTQLRVVSSENNKVTLEDVVWNVDKTAGLDPTIQTGGTVEFNPVAEFGWPGQIENWDGSCQVSGSTATGYGTKWTKWQGRKGLALLYQVDLEVNSQTVRHWAMNSVKSIDSDTQITLEGPAITSRANAGVKGGYKLCSTPTWTCCTEHKNSLFGSGAESHPSRVWISPPDWNPGLMPGYVPPEDIGFPVLSEDGTEYTLDYIDVGGEDENEPVVNLLSTPGPCLALKRGSVYGIFGSYPNFDVSLVSDATGAISSSAAVSVGGRSFWADRNGVWTYQGNRVVNLTEGKIQREWAALLDGWVDGQSFCTLGVCDDHLLVSVGGLNDAVTGRAKSEFDDDNPAERTFLYSISQGTWVSRVSNVNAIWIQSVRVPGEPDGLFFSLPNEKKICDFSSALSGVKTITRSPLFRETATPYDENTKLTGRANPRFDLVTSDSFTGDFVNESRLIDLEVTADTDNDLVAATSSVKGLRSYPSPLQLWLTDTADGLQRHYARVGRSGRQHRIHLARENGEVEGEFAVHELSVNFRGARPRS